MRVLEKTPRQYSSLPRQWNENRHQHHQNRQQVNSKQLLLGCRNGCSRQLSRGPVEDGLGEAGLPEVRGLVDALDRVQGVGEVVVEVAASLAVRGGVLGCFILTLRIQDEEEVILEAINLPTLFSIQVS